MRRLFNAFVVLAVTCAPALAETMMPTPAPTASPMALPSPTPSPTPSPVANATPIATPTSTPIGNGRTVNICAFGTTQTIFPCSNTSFVTDRVFTVTIVAAIGFRDASGAYRIHNVNRTQTFDSSAVGNGFNFCLPEFVPGATEITGINTNVRVSIVLHYGIHGILNLIYDGYGSGVGSSISVGTNRNGQDVVEPGPSQCYGLIPDYESIPYVATVPAPPPPAEPPSCFSVYSTHHSVWGTDYDHEYRDAANACASNGGFIPSRAQLTAGNPNLTGGSCWWTSDPAGGDDRHTYPGGTEDEDNECNVVCMRAGCGSTTAQPVPTATVAP